MADEPTLPRLGPFPVRNSIIDSESARKRVRLSSPPIISSDPAIFSSDDDPSADNYTKERSKKKFRGPWYHQVPASESSARDTFKGESVKKGKRKFERQYDSGIFLGSDNTDTDDLFDSMERANASATSRNSRLIQSNPVLPSAEDLAKQQIESCLEDGNESIDLTSRNLTSLSNATIRPLATFTRVPPVTEGVFEQLEPRLNIFLGLNWLATLPEELFYLDRLTTLSLRGNKLQELSSLIGNLQNLRELNISFNSLRFLPFQILKLFTSSARIKHFQIHPNPFFQPEFPSNDQAEEKTEAFQYKIGLRSHPSPQKRIAIYKLPTEISYDWNSQWKIAFQARSDVRWYDNYGTLLKGPIFPIEGEKNSIPTVDPCIVPEPPSLGGLVSSRAPSLLETALKSCLQSSQFSFLDTLLGDDAPQHIRDLLAKVAVQKEAGSERCTICNRKFIIQRTEWIEWWELGRVAGNKVPSSAASPLRGVENERDTLESMIPLIRRGCSWLCVPKAVEMDVDAMAVDQ